MAHTLTPSERATTSVSGSSGAVGTSQVIDAHTATQMTQPSVMVDDPILSAIQRLTYAVICIAIAVLPAVWSTFPRGYDVHQQESPMRESIR